MGNGVNGITPNTGVGFNTAESEQSAGAGAPQQEVPAGATQKLMPQGGATRSRLKDVWQARSLFNLSGPKLAVALANALFSRNREMSEAAGTVIGNDKAVSDMPVGKGSTLGMELLMSKLRPGFDEVGDAAGKVLESANKLVEKVSYAITNPKSGVSVSKETAQLADALHKLYKSLTKPGTRTKPGADVTDDALANLQKNGSLGQPVGPQGTEWTAQDEVKSFAGLRPVGF